MKILPAILILSVAAGMTGCKTTEANYRAAYEKAMAKRNEGIDSATVSAIDKEDVPPVRRVAEGVSFPVVTKFVKIVDGGGISREGIKKYSVVMTVFKQRFNAISLRERLVDNNLYPGAFVVQTGDDYLVAAGSTDNPNEALALYEEVATGNKFPVKSPFPWVLVRPR